MIDRDVVVRWRGTDGIVRKVAFERTDEGHDRATSRWSGCRWILEGREPVTDVEPGLEGSMSTSTFETRTEP
ncbi:hypothetical protein [Halomontanus rarus]|uniref:hypothetical protein n=1 Tax=Halomontanus rarus TaxID=3034020 RepID=UPI001A98BEDD